MDEAWGLGAEVEFVDESINSSAFEVTDIKELFEFFHLSQKLLIQSRLFTIVLLIIPLSHCVFHFADSGQVAVNLYDSVSFGD